MTFGIPLSPSEPVRCEITTNDEVRRALHSLTRELNNFHRKLSSLEQQFQEQSAAVEELLYTLKKQPTTSEQSKKASEKPVTGTFDTGKGSREDQIGRWTSQSICFGKRYSRPPQIPVALSLLDFGSRGNIRAECESNPIMKTSFTISVGSKTKDDDIYTSYGLTRINQAMCSWMEIEENHPDFQSGTFSVPTGFDASGNSQWENSAPQYDLPPEIVVGTYDELADFGTPVGMENSQWVKFARQYDAPPEVVVWIRLIDLGGNRNRRVKTYATDVSTTGFKIHIDTWGNPVLREASASWVSYTAGKPGVSSGTFSTSRAVQDSSGYVEFSEGTFELSPRTIVGISSFDIDFGQDLRIAVGTTLVNTTGISWYLNTWGDTILNSASASYIALDRTGDRAE